MKVLITGAEGQLGRALVQCAPAHVTIAALGSIALNITDADSVAKAFADHAPAVVINAAAFTAVDLAETEPERAFSINQAGVALLAHAAQTAGARLVHVSTDFVFGESDAVPRKPSDYPAPMSIYGASKLAGEAAAGPDALIVRTAWVYAANGQNFVNTMLRLMRERDEVRVVADQVGTPSWASSLAEAIWALTLQGKVGIFHYTDSGVASWYDFAVAIQEEALELGFLDRAVPIVPITTADYPMPAKRPAFSVLDKTETWKALGGIAPHWRVQLRRMLKELVDHG
ncbi:dTDP-4-dehydrorhamnose reductase [Allopontixanthobacter sediminis]|uniref:dTDP-4-dehydrorhamnose reductase n=1 Tax=Allopontixanthobacter sediminis TaxID=1689985 RepID=A0A845B4Z5_9SPHN|nr:dTDP-4-dehydrorhamnose reductase [Allopontixanthobacter sediminis]MXP44602.1 dTDP-4-dehydrorhamnose reductase [Allopontixanthobacter sediminis]